MNKYVWNHLVWIKFPHLYHSYRNSRTTLSTISYYTIHHYFNNESFIPYPVLSMCIKCFSAWRGKLIDFIYPLDTTIARWKYRGKHCVTITLRQLIVRLILELTSKSHIIYNLLIFAPWMAPRWEEISYTYSNIDV